jgi:hypothetical protein
MNVRWNLLYTLASLFVLTLPTAHGADIDLHQRGLTGSWYEPQTSGQGFMLEVLPDVSSPGKGLVQASWLTYDSVVGGAERQRWYTLSGPVVSGQTHVSMAIYRNTGGNFNAPPITTAHPVGTATLCFDWCTSGQLVYNFTDGSGRASTIPLTRLMSNVTCSALSAPPTDAVFDYSGNRYDAATSGQGFAMEVNPVSRVLFLAWQTYASNGAGAGAAGQRWYTGQGAFVAFPWPIPGQLYETTGGLFDQSMADPTTALVGSGTLTFTSCSSAKLSFKLTGGSSVGASGTIALSYVGAALSSGAGCWDY